MAVVGFSVLSAVLASKNKRYRDQAIRSDQQTKTAEQHRRQALVQRDALQKQVDIRHDIDLQLENLNASQRNDIEDLDKNPVDRNSLDNHE